MNVKLGLSAVVLARNEETFLPKCLTSLAWVDEIIIIGDNPTPKVLEIAKIFGVKIFERELDNFSTQRNFALTKVQTPWVLMVDPDEEVPEELALEIQEVIKKDN